MRHIIDDDSDYPTFYEQPGDIRDDELIGVISRFGAGRPRTAHRADNDNNPDRVTRMVPFNGGCSTTSGKTPVTLPRLGCLGQELAMVTENGIETIRVAA